ncbi:MAG: phosphocholine cytidylyltransferase family protein [Kiloniellales bacterium]|nr:phosphocholine cytidylyltransferase family protein [Kiloniellales bacterium]
MASAVIPQKAVILAAGLGSRLRPLTDRRPKPLVEVHGVPILHNALSHLANIGVREATIVVGYRKEEIERSCGLNFAGIEITYAESSIYDRSGSAYSLWLARDSLLRGDALLLEGDVFFEETALWRLNGQGADDVAAVAPFEETMSGSAVTLSAEGDVAEIRLKQSALDLAEEGGPRLFKTLNLFRFSGEALRRVVVPALDELIASGAIDAYVEQLLARLLQRQDLQLGAARCDCLKWYEIDSEADLRVAETIFAPQLDPLYRHMMMPCAADWPQGRG